MNSLVRAAIVIVFAVAAPCAATAQMCPNNSADSNTRNLTFSAGPGRSMGTRVLAGGGIDIGLCPSLRQSVSAAGYVNYYPDFHLFYESLNMGRGLELRVVSDCDTTLLVNGATGDWHFNDDAIGTNPRIRFNNAFGGRYDIFVGNYSAGFCDAQLIVESY